MRITLGTLKRIIRETVMEAALPDADALVSRGMIAQNLDRTSENPYSKYGREVMDTYTRQGTAAADAMVANIERKRASEKVSGRQMGLRSFINPRDIRSSLRIERNSLDLSGGRSMYPDLDAMGKKKIEILEAQLVRAESEEFRGLENHTDLASVLPPDVVAAFDKNSELSRLIDEKSREIAANIGRRRP